MREKDLFDILENAENDSMERLIDKCPELSDEQLDRILAMSEKKFRKQMAQVNMGAEPIQPSASCWSAAT